MANKELTVHPESRDFTGRLNLFVQTNPALMSVVIAAILLVATFIINPAGFNLVAVGNILLLTIL